MTQEDINILKMYLSEDEIKEIVISSYKSVIINEITKITPNKRLADYERIISNSVHKYLEDEVDNIMSTNTKDLININVHKVLKEGDLSYKIFRSKSVWDTEDSIGMVYLKEAVAENKQIITDKVLNEINSIDFNVLKEEVKNTITQIIDEKLCLNT
jgi:hypothetical protein